MSAKKDWNSYFRNQGFGAKKLIEAHGVGGWRAAFAQTVLISGKKYGLKMHQEAREYLNAWRSGLVEHHNDTFSIKVLYGNKKTYAAGFDQKMAELKAKRLSLANTKANRPIKADLRKLERAFKKESGISAAREALARHKQGYKFDPLFKEKRQESINKRLEDALSYGFKTKEAYNVRQEAMRQMDMMDRQYDGRNLGIAVGSLEEEVTPSESFAEKMIEILKNGGKFSAAQWAGILNNPELRKALIDEWGIDFFKANFQGEGLKKYTREFRAKVRNRVGADEKMYHNFSKSKFRNIRQQYNIEKLKKSIKKK